VDNDQNSRRFESVFSNKVRAGKRRTYFFDVRKTKGEDFYITLTESTKRFNGEGYERHKIFLYKEDFNRFVEGLEEAITHVKTELMPDYDYDEFTRRNQEWEEKRQNEMLQEAEAAASNTEPASESSTDTVDEVVENPTVPEASPAANESTSSGESEEDLSSTGSKEDLSSAESEEDMSW